MKKEIILTATLALLVKGPVGFCQTLTYSRVRGEEKLVTKITFGESSQGFTLTKENPAEKVSVVCAKNGDTRLWEFTDNEARASYRAVRSGKVISLTSRREGKTVRKDLEIDDAPWFQDPGFSLKAFVLSPADGMTFWMVHPRKLSVHRMRVKRRGETSLVLQGRTVTAVKTQMSLDGLLLSMMWTAYHWHRKSDGLFVKYQGGGARPGAPETTVEITDGL